TAPLLHSSRAGWSERFAEGAPRPGEGRHDQLGNFQSILLGRITPASTAWPRLWQDKDASGPRSLVGQPRPGGPRGPRRRGPGGPSGWGRGRGLLPERHLIAVVHAAIRPVRSRKRHRPRCEYRPQQPDVWRLETTT